MVLIVILMLISGYIVFKVSSIIGKVLKRAREAQEDANKIVYNGKDKDSGDAGSDRGGE